MNIEITLQRLIQLIEINSTSGNELYALKKFEEIAQSLDWAKERIPVDDSTYNLLYTFGIPKIIFTTHIDIVAGESDQFIPKISNGIVYGRGSCDAKGSLVTMLQAIEILLSRSLTDFALLIVVGEEENGRGALVAADAMKKREVAYIVNGEPTDNCLAKNTGGVFDLSCHFKGTASHSGYPELGIDANHALLRTCYNLQNISNKNLIETQISSINIGLIHAGISGSTVSPSAELRACIRTTSCDNIDAIRLITNCVVSGTSDIPFNAPYRKLKILPSFESKEIMFASDISNFSELNCEYLMYGPGSIHDAHSRNEKVSVESLKRASEDYVRIYECLCL